MADLENGRIALPKHEPSNRLAGIHGDRNVGIVVAEMNQRDTGLCQVTGVLQAPPRGEWIDDQDLSTGPDQVCDHPHRSVCLAVPFRPRTSTSSLKICRGRGWASGPIGSKACDHRIPLPSNATD